MKKKLFICILILIVVLIGGKYFYDLKNTDKNQVLYESEAAKIGVLIPDGYHENPFAVEEQITEDGVVISFMEPESEALLFTLYSMDKDFWEREVKENFPATYSELYSDENNVILCVNVSDVQYDPDNQEQKEKYFELLDLKDEVCKSLYILE